MTGEIENGDTPETIINKIQDVDDQLNKERIERLKPFSGILKMDIDPLKLQKKWRNEWK